MHRIRACFSLDVSDKEMKASKGGERKVWSVGRWLNVWNYERIIVV